MVGVITFVLLVPVRSEMLVRDCVLGQACPDVTHCYTVLGWQDVLGPLSCSRWSAAAVALAVGLLFRSAARARTFLTDRRTA